MSKRLTGLKAVEALNNATYVDYYERLKRIALSIFEYENLPDSMDGRYLERCLFYYGQAALLKDERFGLINTKCSTDGNLNIYGLPVSLQCWSYEYSTYRKLYQGENTINDASVHEDDCILIMNTWERIPTSQTLELYARRLAESERACDVNIKAQKTPMLLLCDDKQHLTLKNLYYQYDGNAPVIMGDKNALDETSIKAIKTDAPFVADKLKDYQKQIWNEALTFLGINNISTEKKERLVTGETSENNELINMNLQSYLAPRKRAIELFNERYDQNVEVKVRSDLFNIIKQEESLFESEDREIIANAEDGRKGEDE